MHVTGKRSHERAPPPLKQRKGQTAKRAIAFLIAVSSPLFLVQTLQAETPASETAVLAAESNTNAMTWPLLPGENIAALAALFYPDNPQLQKRFIVKTLQLSRELHPQLNAQTASNQAQLIIIPTLKSLAQPTGKIRVANTVKKAPWTAPLQMSYGLKDAALFAVPDALQAKYTQLLERNASLKLQLEELNAKIAQLQQTLTNLSLDAKRFLDQAALSPAAPLAAGIAKPETQQVFRKPVAQDAIAEVKLLNQTEAEASPHMFKLWLWLPLLLLAALLAVLARWYNHRKSKQLYLASVETFDPIMIEEAEVPYRRGIEDVDFSLTQNGLSAMSVTDLGQFESLQDEDGELSLEQARIYVHIDRVDEAIELLKAHIQRTPKTALHHWLYLLDIYRDTGQRDAFEQYAEQLHRTFNVMMPLWESETLPIVIASSIEEFPHIVQQLTTLWGDPDKSDEVQAFLADLLMDNRDSIRAGFSMAVFQEILFLKDVWLARTRLDDQMQEADSE